MMWYDQADDREFISELASPIVDEIAPEEKPYFNQLIRGFFEDPTPPAWRKSSDSPLESGIPDLLATVTPAVAAVLGGLLTLCVTAFSDAVKAELGDWFKSRIKKLFRVQEDTSKDKLQAPRDANGAVQQVNIQVQINNTLVSRTISVTNLHAKAYE